MQETDHHHLPDENRLSIVIAVVLLAYAVSPYVKAPVQGFVVRVTGLVFPFQIEFSTVIGLLAATLAATGMYWIISSHPYVGGHHPLAHGILPALTAWAIGVPLNTGIIKAQWWGVFALGGALLVLVCLAEYIVVDFADSRHGPATVGLTAVSFALFLVLVIALRAAELRLYLLLPAILITIFLMSLRTLYLRLEGRWSVEWAAVIAGVVAQIALALHYMPIAPLNFGLFLLGVAYALTSLAGAVLEGQPWRTLWIEPTIILAFSWLLAIIM